jgi:divinyl protochlorophyllide a 8-vinyl-reductase
MARIGPNAVTRLAEAAEDQLGRAACDRLFQTAGLAAYRQVPPEAMVEEADVVALHRALAALHPESAARVAADAGVRTAHYLLTHRIPRLAQAVLRRLPPGLAARALIAAIGKHAWTFAGSGRFEAKPDNGMAISIEGGPFSEAGAASPSLVAFYEAVFATLFRTLVSARARVDRTASEDGACRFALVWTRPAPPRPNPLGAAHG